MSVLENPTASLKAAYTALRSLESDIQEMSDVSNLEYASVEETLQLASDMHMIKSYTTELFNELQSMITQHLGHLPAPVAVDGATVEIKSEVLHVRRGTIRRLLMMLASGSLTVVLI